MKRLMQYIFMMFCGSIIAQSSPQKRSYLFDTYESIQVLDHSTNIYRKSYVFRNSKDTDYILELFPDTQKASLMNYKKPSELIHFDYNFEYKEPQDLYKLTNPQLYTELFYHSPKRYKTKVEEVSYIKDSVANQVILRLKIFKNKKKKKIVRDLYYYFSESEPPPDSEDPSPFVQRMISDYNMFFLKNLKLTKTVQIFEDNKKVEIDFFESKAIDFVFSFEVNDIYPKNKVLVR